MWVGHKLIGLNLSDRSNPSRIRVVCTVERVLTDEILEKSFFTVKRKDLRGGKLETITKPLCEESKLPWEDKDAELFATNLFNCVEHARKYVGSTCRIIESQTDEVATTGEIVSTFGLKGKVKLKLEQRAREHTSLISASIHKYECVVSTQKVSPLKIRW